MDGKLYKIFFFFLMETSSKDLEGKTNKKHLEVLQIQCATYPPKISGVAGI